MNELLVLRHAKSSWSTGLGDFDRPLAPRGERVAPLMATWLDDNDLRPDRVISSSAVRARDTAGFVIDHFELPADVVSFRDELYLAGVETWLDTLAGETASRVLVCGHNPGLDWLVEYLASDPPPETDDGKLMTTAAIAYLRFDGGWDALERGSGRLVDLARPRELF